MTILTASKRTKIEYPSVLAFQSPSEQAKFYPSGRVRGNIFSKCNEVLPFSLLQCGEFRGLRLSFADNRGRPPNN
jgi:hypothetical protein